METENQKKKRRGNVCDGNGESTRRTRPRSEERAVLEDEVKEFCEILHRIRDATGCGGRLTGDRTAVGGKEGLGRWRPTFMLEDFEEAAVAGNEISSGEALPVEKEAVRIDLNAEPEAEGSTEMECMKLF
ncbi:hypothetical protein KFK09_026713 [Dendrobium nobile]|uniref:Uncharacterized protein n=1 Tax=Dendrobium nobile TaxID=94219 RepID=A0A8T3A8B0_DENNO|nr:hypothetical protein KFK09_026713 [Dendrobium nobile]